MIDLEKVIKGLVSCNSASCQKCPYNEKKECNNRGFFYSQAIEEAIQIFKEQEAVIPLKHYNQKADLLYACGKCHNDLKPNNRNAKFCWFCGRKVKWDDR